MYTRPRTTARRSSTIPNPGSFPGVVGSLSGGTVGFLIPTLALTLTAHAGIAEDLEGACTNLREAVFHVIDDDDTATYRGVDYDGCRLLGAGAVPTHLELTDARSGSGHQTVVIPLASAWLEVDAEHSAGTWRHIVRIMHP